jgi:hypothetical protein
VTERRKRLGVVERGHWGLLGAGVVGWSEARRPLGGHGDIWRSRHQEHPHKLLVDFTLTTLGLY